MVQHVRGQVELGKVCLWGAERKGSVSANNILVGVFSTRSGHRSLFELLIDHGGVPFLVDGEFFFSFPGSLSKLRARNVSLSETFIWV